MHSDRRPCAAVVEHTGHRDKTLAPIPKPPPHVLEVLSAEPGLDSMVPVRGTGKLRSRGMMLDRNGTTSALSRRGPDNWGTTPGSNGLFDSNDEALIEEKLQNPFKFATKVYHASQQAVLNTELRFKLEKLVKDWKDRLEKLRTLIGQYPVDGAMINTRALEGLRSYIAGYRCAEDLTLPATHLVQNLQLQTSLTEIEQAEGVPRLQLDGVQYSLNSLLSSDHLIAPLEEYLEALQVLDQVSCLVLDGGSPCEGSAAALVKAPAGLTEGKGDGAAATAVLLPSKVAVVLHERYHFNPGEYALGELQKSHDYLQNMEDGVLATKARKDAAVYRGEPIEALRNLHAQIDLANEMLLLNKARMELVGLYGEDIRALRAELVERIEGAETAAERLRRRTSTLLLKVAKDLAALQEAMRVSHDELSGLERQEEAAEAAAQEALKTFQAEERGYWEQIRDLLEQLAGAAARKEEFVMRHMNQRERRARAYAETFNRLKAEEAHSERLSGVQIFAQHWEQGGGIYQKYVDAFVPKLLKRLAAIEEAARDLQQNESQDYVRRYEMFAYAAEEARAKRSVQADRMRLTQRSMQLNQECAFETLDPTVEQHAQRYAEAGRELEEVLAYIAYLESIEKERKEEIDPVLQSVLEHNRLNTTDPLELDKRELLRLLDESAQAEQQISKDNGSAPGPVERNEALVTAMKAENAMTTTQSAQDQNGALSVLTKTVAHPFVSARQQGIAHEEVYVEKHQQLTEAELCAAETKMDRVRKNKLEQAEMSMKYQNADYIRTLLAASDLSC